jgi:hypothetical protein
MGTYPFTAIDHVQLAMPSGGEDQARAFYGMLLGMREVPKPAELAKRGGCWFEWGLRLRTMPAFLAFGVVTSRIRLGTGLN